jgi:hypothetical protein
MLEDGLDAPEASPREDDGLTNHADGEHAFDLESDSPNTRAAVRQVISFLQERGAGGDISTKAGPS